MKHAVKWMLISVTAPVLVASWVFHAAYAAWRDGSDDIRALSRWVTGL